MNAEKQRLTAQRQQKELWSKWGPYLSERQWGTVREDYSPDGEAWDYFPHDHARSRAYRWGEDGLAGFSDDKQILCLGLALWNGRDPILKERLFGLANREGNHGEDVKELYYYLDATPTHSYMRMLYKYPQAAYPYEQLLEENARRDKTEPEFELIDTGIFDDDRYFDVFVEYAKVSPDDVLIRISAHNRGPEPATLHLLPQIWFRNTWSWKEGAARPILHAMGREQIAIEHPEIGTWHYYADDQPALLFCENESNLERFGGGANNYTKDAIHDYVVGQRESAVNPARAGTKAAVHYQKRIASGTGATIHLRLSRGEVEQPFDQFDRVFAQRIQEADDFYAELQGELNDADARNVQRQAWAGMIWCKQLYRYNVFAWLQGDANLPATAERYRGRNRDWQHLDNADIISMPDKWEYPWYAAWDLAFHSIPLAMIDADFAKAQLLHLTQPWYMHPTGQLPAYEWNFSDVNPPVHAAAALRVFQMDRKFNQHSGDFDFLRRVFHKLLLNFTWWVNRKDNRDRNIFQGGFLGLDNIGVFNRDQPLPDGEILDQADGTSWMAMYCLNLMRIAIVLAEKDPAYQDLATKFFEHFLQIADAMTGLTSADGHTLDLWDSEDEFYYDAINYPDDRRMLLKVRSIVGLIPLFAVETLDQSTLEHVPEFRRRLKWIHEHRPDLCGLVSHWDVPGVGKRILLSLLRGHRMKCLLRRMLDESEFLSDFGVRGLSKFHRDSPYVLHSNGEVHTVDYEPGESQTSMFGGNSNWRGPIWFPINFLIIESLQKFHHYYGDDFKIECPTGSGQYMTILQVSQELTRRLTRLFLRDENGRRPALGDNEKLQTDPHFRDYLPFFEYFHGDTGRGCGAAHQTGWTGLIAKLLQPRREESAPK